VIASATTEWLTAVGTVSTAVAAVGVTIGLQWWTRHAEKRKAPGLTLERDASWFASESGWPHLSLAVRNAPGKRAANDVQVSVEVITEGGGAVVLRPSNMTLPWSNLFDREIALRPMTIPAGGRRYVDLGSFVDATRPERLDRPAFRVAARTSGLGDHHLEISPCLFELTISASNCDVSMWRAELRFEQSDADPQKPMKVDLAVGRW
jgi:hypothetical protein